MEGMGDCGEGDKSKRGRRIGCIRLYAGSAAAANRGGRWTQPRIDTHGHMCMLQLNTRCSTQTNDETKDGERYVEQTRAGWSRETKKDERHIQGRMEGMGDCDE